jgi:hypothetical protein
VPSTALDVAVSHEEPAILRQGEAEVVLEAPVPGSRVSTIRAGSGFVSNAKTFRELRVRDAALMAWLGQQSAMKQGDAFDSEVVMGGDSDEEVTNSVFDSLALTPALSRWERGM